MVVVVDSNIGESINTLFRNGNQNLDKTLLLYPCVCVRACTCVSKYHILMSGKITNKKDLLLWCFQKGMYYSHARAHEWIWDKPIMAAEEAGPLPPPQREAAMFPETTNCDVTKSGRKWHNGTQEVWKCVLCQFPNHKTPASELTGDPLGKMVYI